jgi:excisionase family DNA binding protein
MMEFLLSAKKAAEVVGVPVGTLYRLARAGIVPSFKVGIKRRGIRFRASELIDALRSEPAKTLDETNQHNKGDEK